MNWHQLLKKEIASAYGSAAGLVRMADDEKIHWKPATGENWMTMGQLLMHITNACGDSFRGFITGDWGLPDGMDPSEMPPEEMLPSAEKLPAVSTTAEAIALLEKDQKLALNLLDTTDEDALAAQNAPAPWDPTAVKLGYRLLQMVGHLNSHKHQLYYYMKLQGKPVNTGHLWGM